MQSENAEYGDAFVQKLADFFAMNNTLQGQRKSVNAVDTIELVKPFEDNVSLQEYGRTYILHEYVHQGKI